MADSKSALAVFAHPDDIEFCAAGTLLLLAEQGWNIHYFNLSSGDLGSFDHERKATQEIRRREITHYQIHQSSALRGNVTNYKKCG